jgi:hypothetical protein
MYEVKIRSEIHKLIFSIWNKEEFSAERNESVILAIYKKSDKADCSNYKGIAILSITHKVRQTEFFKCHGYLHLQVKLSGSSVRLLT